MGARLRLKRDSGFADFIRRYDVLVNGKVVGQVKNGGVFECDIPAGKISVELRVDFCGSGALGVEVLEGGVVDLECGSNLRGWKLLKAQKVMREAPDEWIWLRKRAS